MQVGMENFCVLTVKIFYQFLRYNRTWVFGRKDIW